MGVTASFTQSLLLCIILLMPVLQHISRFEANEAHRAGWLSILIILMLRNIFLLIPKLKQAQKILLFCISFYVLALVTSTVFSISPIHSLFGDSVRRMGLLTQLALIACIFLIWQVSAKRLWFYFWLGGLLIGIQILLEASQLDEVLIRISGLFGWGTFTGGWLMAAMIWSVIGFLVYGYQRIRTIQRLFVIGSGLVIGIAFIILGSRAAALSMVVGLFLAGLIWAVKMRRHKMLLVVVSLIVFISGATFALSRVYYGDSPLSSTFLLQRLKYPVFDFFREQIWQDSLKIVVTNPQLTRYDGSLDNMSGIRPLIGYGSESFEAPQHAITVSNIPAVDDTLRIDRAHNIWYDTYIMHGLFGCIALLSVYLVAIGVALRKLKLLNPSTIIGTLAGFALGIVFTPGVEFLPPTATFGAVGGLIIGIFLSLYFHSHDDRSISVNALISLSVLIAHIIESQFGFITIATGVIPWLAIGLLFVNDQDPEDMLDIPHWIWLSIVGAFIIRIPLGNLLHNSVLLATLLIIYLLWERDAKKQLFIVFIMWGISALNLLITSPELTILWDVGLLIVAVWLIHGSQVDSITINLSLQTAVFGLFFAVIGIIWCMDILAGNYRLLYSQSMLANDRIRYITSSSILRPYDDRLLMIAGNENLSYGLLTKDDFALGRSINLMQQAVNIHGYNANYAISLALLESQLSIITDEPETHIKKARNYYLSATTMWTHAGSFWREWARFEFEIAGDIDSAKEKIIRAIELLPDDIPTSELYEKIMAN